jgi:hypothetical protein
MLAIWLLKAVTLTKSRHIVQRATNTTKRILTFVRIVAEADSVRCATERVTERPIIAVRRRRLLNMYIEITQDTGLCNDSGEFRQFELMTGGSSPQELAENAFIVEVDQDGNDHECHPLSEYCERVYQRCMVIIAKAWLESQLEAA